MKKNIFVAAMTIALAAVVVSCNQSSKEQNKLPEGTPIGQVFMVTQENGTKVLQDSTGYGIGDIYQDISMDSNGFIVAVKPDGDMDLMTAKGATFAHCTEYSVLPYYQTTDKASDKKFVATTVGSNGNHLAFDFDTQKRLVDVEGIKDVTLPLDNGYVLFKIKGKWGVAKQDASEPILGAVCSSIASICTSNKVYFWVASPDFTGVIDTEGEAVKATSLKVYKRTGKTLWNEGEASAIFVKNI